MTRILLIEDDDETADEVMGYLRGRAYDVTRAATGPDGLLQAGTGIVDAIVLDRMLPDLDGPYHPKLAAPGRDQHTRYRGERSRRSRRPHPRPPSWRG